MLLFYNWSPWANSEKITIQFWLVLTDFASQNPFESWWVMIVEWHFGHVLRWKSSIFYQYSIYIYTHYIQKWWIPLSVAVGYIPRYRWSKAAQSQWNGLAARATDCGSLSLEVWSPWRAHRFWCFDQDLHDMSWPAKKRTWRRNCRWPLRGRKHCFRTSRWIARRPWKWRRTGVEGGGWSFLVDVPFWRENPLLFCSVCGCHSFGWLKVGQPLMICKIRHVSWNWLVVNVGVEESNPPHQKKWTYLRTEP